MGIKAHNRKNKNFHVDFLKKVRKMKLQVFGKEHRVTVKEQTGVLLYLTSSIISIVIGTLSFIYTFNIPFINKLRIISLIWVVLGFIGIFAVDYYLDKRDESGLRVLFYITLLNFMSASSFFFSALMCFVGTYFIFEDLYSDQ